MKILTTFSLLLFVFNQAWSQQTIQERYNQFYEKASNWEDYKMTKVKDLDQFWLEVSDSLLFKDQIYADKVVELKVANERLRQLEANVASIQAELDKSNNQNQSIGFFGLEFTKPVYHGLVWSLIVLLIISVGGIYGMFLRSNKLTTSAIAELKDIQHEFADHREHSQKIQIKLKRELQTAINTLQEHKMSAKR